MDQKQYTSEYLLVFSEDRKLFQDEEGLINVIKQNTKLKIEIKNKLNILTFDGVDYILDIKKIKSEIDNYRSYIVKIKTKNGCNDESEQFKLSRANKELIDTIKDLKYSQLNTLRDDLASEFSIDGYKHIHEIENKMRKLITIFMSTKVGLGWDLSNTPKDVIESIKSQGTKVDSQSLNTFLSETDFIQLSKFLFDKYSTLKVNDVHRILQRKESERSFDDLMDFIPKSNWQRYFLSEHDGKKEDEIVDAWDMLYELRNKVAHNRFITYSDRQKILSKKESMNKFIDAALKNIEEIKVTERQTLEIKEEFNSTIVEDKEKTNEKEQVNNVIKETNADIISDSELTIKKLTKYIYMDIDDNFKKELRKYRSKLNRCLEDFKTEKDNQLKSNMLTLALARANDYTTTIISFL